MRAAAMKACEEMNQSIALLGFALLGGCVTAETATFILSANAANGPSWNGHGNGPEATRFQNARAGGISAADLPRLKLKWAFGYANVGSARMQPAMAGDHLKIVSDENRICEPEPLDRVGNQLELLAGVRPRVACVRTQPVGRDVLDGEVVHGARNPVSGFL